MRWSDLSTAELEAELRFSGLPSVEGGGSDLPVVLDREQLEPLAVALTCETAGSRMVCPSCRQEVISGCEFGLFDCLPCGLLLLAPIDYWEPRPA